MRQSRAGGFLKVAADGNGLQSGAGLVVRTLEVADRLAPSRDMRQIASPMPELSYSLCVIGRLTVCRKWEPHPPSSTSRCVAGLQGLPASTGPHCGTLYSFVYGEPFQLTATAFAGCSECEGSSGYGYAPLVTQAGFGDFRWEVWEFCCGVAGTYGVRESDAHSPALLRFAQ
ncbi:MAG: hypothetical protein U0R19_30510 [Bryobacteraceae bacterium]